VNNCTCGHSAELHVNQAAAGEQKRVRCVSWVGLGRCVCTKFLDVEEHAAAWYATKDEPPLILKEK
jgi:hypothetical protein